MSGQDAGAASDKSEEPGKRCSICQTAIMPMDNVWEAGRFIFHRGCAIRLESCPTCPSEWNISYPERCTSCQKDFEEYWTWSKFTVCYCGEAYHLDDLEKNPVCRKCGRTVPRGLIPEGFLSKLCSTCRGIIWTPQEGVKCPCGSPLHRGCVIAENRCHLCGAKLKRPESIVCYTCKKPVDIDRDALICRCGAVFHRSCSPEGNICPVCSTKRPFIDMDDFEMVCGICGLRREKYDSFTYCACGKKYHAGCALSKQKCPSCGESLNMEITECAACKEGFKNWEPLYICACGKQYHVQCLKKMGGSCLLCGRRRHLPLAARQQNCPLCKKGFVSGQDGIECTNCSILFHQACIKPGMKCPNCYRKDGFMPRKVP
ncbi:MAG: hypothetical protein QW728_03005 [Thermoplasmata archaeon]